MTPEELRDFARLHLFRAQNLNDELLANAENLANALRNAGSTGQVPPDPYGDSFGTGTSPAGRDLAAFGGFARVLPTPEPSTSLIRTP